MYFGKCTIFALTYPERRWWYTSKCTHSTHTHTLAPYKDADPTEWNCQDGFQCIMCLRYTFFRISTLLAVYVLEFCSTAKRKERKICDKGITHTKPPHFKMKFFHCIYSIVSSLFPLHCTVLALSLFLRSYVAIPFPKRCSIFTPKNRKKNSKSTLQFSANAMRSNVRNIVSAVVNGASPSKERKSRG